MAVMWDAPGYHGETGRINGSKGSYGTYTSVYGGLEKELAAKLDFLKKPLPPGVNAGGHGGSHAYLTDDFLRGILVPGHKVCCGLKTALERVEWRKPKLPPGMPAGGHGGSHGYLTDDFIRAILLKDHRHCCDLKTSLNATLAGIYAHISAEKGGETLKIPEL